MTYSSLFSRSIIKPRIGFLNPAGFTLIELMIVIALISIILTLALPIYSNYTIRSKISESLTATTVAQTAIASACVQRPTVTALDNETIDYAFTESPWVGSVTVGGSCQEPFITLLTRNTGATGPQPEITLSGFPEGVDGKFNWVCSAPELPDDLTPASCRN